MVHNVLYLNLHPKHEVACHNIYGIIYLFHYFYYHTVSFYFKVMTHLLKNTLLAASIKRTDSGVLLSPCIIFPSHYHENGGSSFQARQTSSRAFCWSPIYTCMRSKITREIVRFVSSCTAIIKALWSCLTRMVFWFRQTALERLAWPVRCGCDQGLSMWTCTRP